MNSNASTIDYNNLFTSLMNNNNNNNTNTNAPVVNAIEQQANSPSDNTSSICDSMFETESELRNKKTSPSTSGFSASSSDSTFACRAADCGKIFKSKAELIRHMASGHKEARPFYCTHEGCGKSFKRADALENHLRIHTGETPFVCPYEDCGASFTTKASLRYHVLKHKDEKVYECTFPGCNKSFITLFQLKQHLKARNVHNKISTTSSVIPVSTPCEATKQAYKSAKPAKKVQKEKALVAEKVVNTDLSATSDSNANFLDSTANAMISTDSTASYGVVKTEYNNNYAPVAEQNFNGYEFFENQAYPQQQQQQYVQEPAMPNENYLMQQNEDLKKRLEISEKLLLSVLKQQKPQANPVHEAAETFNYQFSTAANTNAAAMVESNNNNNNYDVNYNYNNTNVTYTGFDDTLDLFCDINNNANANNAQY
mmetsp:Transcript_41973/g.58396  ORF Transcript_41973/g.58396 Transcript_41973/m.58396 type:complete len:427 (-) Transcript_41973:444-1724(-)